MMRGFTLIELIVTVAIVSVLASVAFPMAELAAQRSRERELHRALEQIRDAIDAYKHAVDDGRIVNSMQKSGYPPSLAILRDGAADAASPGSHARLVFLRRIPRDPMATDPGVADEDTWGKRDYASSADEPHEGEDVFDVYSRADGSGLNGIAYRNW